MENPIVVQYLLVCSKGEPWSNLIFPFRFCTVVPCSCHDHQLIPTLLFTSRWQEIVCCPVLHVTVFVFLNLNLFFIMHTAGSYIFASLCFWRAFLPLAAAAAAWFCLPARSGLCHSFLLSPLSAVAKPRPARPYGLPLTTRVTVCLWWLTQWTPLANTVFFRSALSRGFSRSNTCVVLRCYTLQCVVYVCVCVCFFLDTVGHFLHPGCRALRHCLVHIKVSPDSYVNLFYYDIP